MAEIPTYTSRVGLPREAGVARATGIGALTATGGAGTELITLGKGLGQAAGMIGQVVAKRKRLRDAVSAIKAQGQINQFFYSFEESLQQRTDYENFDNDFSSQFEAAFNNSLAGLSKEAQIYFSNYANKKFAQNRITIGRKAWQIESSKNLADTLTLYNKSIEMLDHEGASDALDVMKEIPGVNPLEVEKLRSGMVYEIDRRKTWAIAKAMPLEEGLEYIDTSKLKRPDRNELRATLLRNNTMQTVKMTEEFEQDKDGILLEWDAALQNGTLTVEQVNMQSFIHTQEFGEEIVKLKQSWRGIITEHYKNEIKDLIPETAEDVDAELLASARRVGVGAMRRGDYVARINELKKDRNLSPEDEKVYRRLGETKFETAQQDMLTAEREISRPALVDLDPSELNAFRQVYEFIKKTGTESDITYANAKMVKNKVQRWNFGRYKRGLLEILIKKPDIEVLDISVQAGLKLSAYNKDFPQLIVEYENEVGRIRGNSIVEDSPAKEFNAMWLKLSLRQKALIYTSLADGVPIEILLAADDLKGLK